MIQDKIFFDEKDPTGISYNTPFTVYGSYQGRLWSKTPTGSIKYYTQNSDLSVYATTGSNSFNGNQTVTGSLTVTGGVTGTATTASYVEYAGVANKPALVSGSSQVTYSGLTGVPAGIVSGSSQITYSGISGIPSGIVSGSAQVAALGFATTGSNTFQANQTITGSLFITQNLVVAGSSSIQYISSSVLDIADNIITVNAFNPGVRFGGLAVIDSGSSPQVSGSLLFDSIKDQWIFVHQNQAVVTSSVLLMGPETYNDLGNESYISANRLPKGSGVEHLRDSNITDTGTVVSVNSNTAVTGSFTVVTGSAVELRVTNLGVNIGSALTDSHIISGSLTVNPNGLFVSGSGNVGIGTTSPASLLDISSGTTTDIIRFGASSRWGFRRENNDNRYVAFYRGLSSTPSAVWTVDGDNGNLGLGVTPSAWGLRGFDISNGSLFGDTNNVGLTQNAYYGSSWVYKNNGTAANYIVVGNEHRWNIAPSGTAGNAISFTQAMTLNASGNLMIGTTTAVGRLTVQQSTDATNGGISIFSVNGDGSIISRLNDGGLTFRNGGEERMRITSGGNVGIGTSTGFNSVSGTETTLHISNSNAASLYLTSTAANKYAIYSGAGGTLQFFNVTQNNYPLAITSGGNVLIGTTSDNGAKLRVHGTGPDLGPGINVPNVIVTGASGFQSIGFRRDADGNGGWFIGTSHSVVGDFGIYQNQGASTPVNRLSIGTTGAATFSSFVGINGSPATAFPLEAYINSSTAYTTSSRGNVMRVYNSNTSANIFAGIELGGAGTANDGLAGLNAVVTGSGSAALTFYTRDSNTFAERMRITSGGEVLVNSTSTGLGFANASKFGSYQPYTTDSNTTTLSTQRTAGMFAVSGGDNSNNQGSYVALAANVQWGASNNPGALFRGYQNTTLSVQINYNGNITNTNNSYGAISDISLKENIVDTTPKLNDLLAVRIRNYNLKGDATKQLGVVAQELEEVFPSMVETGSDSIKSVKYSVFVPMLIKAIQELKSENDTLKSILQRNNIS